MNCYVHVEMLGVRIKDHVEAIKSLFGLNKGVGFNKNIVCKEKTHGCMRLSLMVMMEKTLGR